jgi:16S rRNA (cytidine1402-2'-O)-methyltransferase
MALNKNESPKKLPGTCPGTLYVVGTPIGNRDDITLRALSILGEVDLIAAEDTRKTRNFLALHAVKNDLISYHEHNESGRTDQLLTKLGHGLSIALVSNAGMPTVSDPGYRLITAALANHFKVVPIPGVSAITTAQSVGGLPTDSFVFLGFPAKKKAKRLRQLNELAKEPRTLIFYESPKRILRLLAEIRDAMGNRPAVLAREMTKLHEEFIRGSLSHIEALLKDRANIKGECTLLVAGSDDTSTKTWQQIRFEIQHALEAENKPVAEVAKNISKKYRLPKNKIYEETLKFRNQRTG